MKISIKDRENRILSCIVDDKNIDKMHIVVANHNIPVIAVPVKAWTSNLMTSFDFYTKYDINEKYVICFDDKVINFPYFDDINKLYIALRNRITEYMLETTLD